MILVRVRGIKLFSDLIICKLQYIMKNLKCNFILFINFTEKHKINSNQSETGFHPENSSPFT